MSPTEGITRITLLQTPPSLNAIGARGNPRMFHRRKKGWQRMLGAEMLVGIAQDAIPRRLERVTVSGRLEFETSRRRDEGNYRTLLEKALGDALTSGGFLEDDTPDRYRFERLEIEGPLEQARTVLDLRWEIA